MKDNNERLDADKPEEEEVNPAEDEVTADEVTADEAASEPAPDGTAAKHGVQGFIDGLYEICEMIGIVTIAVMLFFAFGARLSIVDGRSMNQTLYHGEYLVVSDLFYKPTPGDIVVIHDITASPYDEPIVKRVIATEFQTVDIDFSTWTLTVDGKVIDEPYRYLDPDRMLFSDYEFPITVPEGEIFVLGDNRNNSADSRQSELGTIDERCVVGKAIFRLFPFNRITVFKNPYDK